MEDVMCVSIPMIEVGPVAMPTAGTAQVKVPMIVSSRRMLNVFSSLDPSSVDQEVSDNKLRSFSLHWLTRSLQGEPQSSA